VKPIILFAFVLALLIRLCLEVARGATAGASHSPRPNRLH
jgi:hypothetical protein